MTTIPDSDSQFYLLADLTCPASCDPLSGQSLTGFHPQTVITIHQIRGAKGMLVLSRKKNESIIIDENICIEVLQIKGKQIRLGITAPRSMKILRGELPARSTANSLQSDAQEISPLPANSSDAAQQIINCDISAMIGNGFLASPKAWSADSPTN